MDHPNIAKVLDAGATESGRPYFAMELVRGIPITEYCDRKRLRTPERLKLFVAACQAIQHAHQKGVIHRDVKPSNVLVTEHDGTPVPKVIDFGVAKAINQRLTERTIYTRHQQMIGTPLYMSPEQADLSALDVDTRSDVYSLGVLLYELLTGVTPFDQQRFREAAYDEMRRIIREEEPPKPSTRISTLGKTASTVLDQRQTDSQKLRQLLRGELDWVVMKALEKDRSRRYETANELAADVERYLRNEAVTACPPSRVYQFRKFARRNKGLLLTATSFGAVLLFATIISLWQAQVAQNERDLAQRQQQRAESVLDLMKKMLSSASLAEGNPRDFTVREMLDRFAQTLDGQFEDRPEVGADIWFALGETYTGIDQTKAINAYRQGLPLAREMREEQPLLLARYLWQLSIRLTWYDAHGEMILHVPEAETLLSEAAEILEGLDATVEPSPHLIQIHRAHLQTIQHRFKDAEMTARNWVESMTADSKASGENYLMLANAVFKQNKGGESEVLSWIDRSTQRYTEQLRRARRAGTYLVPHFQDGLAEGYAFKGYILFEQGALEEADACFSDSLDVYDSVEHFAPRVYVDAMCVRAWTWLRLGKTDDARHLLEETLRATQSAGKTGLEAEVLHHLARMALLEGAADEAEGYLTQAIETCRQAFRDDGILTVRAKIWLVKHYELLGQHGRAAEMLDDLRTNIEGFVRQSGRNAEWVARLAYAKSHGARSTESDLSEAMQLARDAIQRIPRFGYYPHYVNTLPRLSLAKSEMRLERPLDAIATLRKGLQERQVFSVYEWLTAEDRRLELLKTHGTEEDIEELLRDAVEYREQVFPATHPTVLEAKRRLADWLTEQSRSTAGKSPADDR